MIMFGIVFIILSVWLLLSWGVTLFSFEGLYGLPSLPLILLLFGIGLLVVGTCDRFRKR